MYLKNINAGGMDTSLYPRVVLYYIKKASVISWNDLKALAKRRVLFCL
jgi:hypothetical protein